MEKQASESLPKDGARNALEKKEKATAAYVHRLAAIARSCVEWGLGVGALFLFLTGVHREISKNGALSIFPKAVILATVGISVYNWRGAIFDSVLSRREEHLFYHKTVIAIIIGLFGALSGNPWLLFFLTARSLNLEMFAFMLLTHMLIWGSTCFIESAAINQAISTYPTLATTVVNMEEILSDKGMHCAYDRSKKYLLGLSVVYISLCILGFVFYPHAEVVRLLVLNPAVPCFGSAS
ncbi:uncharacterized protein NEMAJ01_1314 [Nematocida major]|uniref:uncharacterized protein n=1 Tax=Nematocida major TaxID=1912982 RepID=UPI0020087850|nr:uncharacterized protein NEMAJ01_1314 [Nematocida major]KAH9386418.1 hypothetical protein NEMAJ01_1314 [Nematocida major]